jgi:hypothetical protein
MIASIKRPKPETRTPAWHASFLAMLPAIRRQAQITFRKVPLELRHDLIQEVIANCFTGFQPVALARPHPSWGNARGFPDRRRGATSPVLRASTRNLPAAVAPLP